ncbi:MAG: putative molybdenum carrier protein, partial [Candidatus Marinimicrobia bacterium]|nr:putative molybdenum carrier protein [Candidatus Neomarinimicrobiota bacterium]
MTKIISGGQTGADRAGLDAAMELNIPVGGWCPKGRKSEDGPIDNKYPLQETTSGDYRVRTERNVKESDGTLIFTLGKPTGGTALT